MTDASAKPVAPAPAPAVPKGGAGRRKVALIVALGLAEIAAAIGVPYYLYTLSHKSTDDAFLAGHITSVAPRVSGHVANVLVEDNQWVEEGALIAELDPADYKAALAVQQGTLGSAEAKLETAKAALALTSITAYAGLDEATSLVKVAAAGVDSARTRVSSAETKLEQAQAAVTVAKASVDEAQAGTAAAAAQAELDASNLKRYEEMLKGDAITQQEFDRVKTASAVSAAQLETAKKKVASAEAVVAQAEAGLKGADDGLREARSMLAQSEAGESQAKAHEAGAKSAPDRVKVSEADVRVAEAEVEKARAGVKTAELALSYTQVRAPRAGWITNKMVRKGTFVQTGQALLALVPADVWVVANYKETDLTRMAPGQPVEIRIDAYPGVVFRGRVDSIQAGSGAAFSLLPPENASGNYIKVVQRVPVKIVFDPAPDVKRYHLAPGMSIVPTVNVSVKGEEKAKTGATPQGDAAP